ncbi:hypothetical protein PVL29_017316 [Vitis rotundifolia]|uniref:Disease resistance RPP13-like protein 1 n=1 Tax=Vitis rotundifolia TaxID=103349 RepID=A0AA39DIH6_VITRO|nr:hypothetical protein PVL29_017316 [Vitis rotundifolia]
MEVVGEALLSAAVGLLFDKLASSDLLDFARQQWVYSDLKKWEIELSDIREQLNDAEEKQITKLSVKVWVGNMRDLAYDMEDILDEFIYESLRRKLEAEEADHQGRSSKVRKLFSNCLATFNPTAVMRYINIRVKVREITRRLQDISAQRAELSLEKVVGITKSARERPITTSLVYEPWVYGRNGDKKIILDMILRDEPTEANVSVVSIVAMGGMGKTTLARLVYDDAETTKHFDLKAWVCVSDKFDAVRITNTVLNSVTSESSDAQDFDQIQDKLRGALKERRFLIVFDDWWNEKYSQWDSLRSPFLEGAEGSKILVTSRSKNVAIMMGGDKNMYELKQLSDDDCWLVFQKHAFEHTNISVRGSLASIGRRIVQKCGGLPLAAKTLGGLLRAEIREDEWKRVLNSKVWDIPGKECDIIPALRLSYNHLPSHLKRCFAYCAIFPTDYEFEQKELILLWMAEGLIQQSKDNMMEDLGGDYFHELLSRSFFQPSSSNESRFVMHDLVNDLAQFVAGETCLHLNDKLEIDLQCPISKSIHHSSFIRRNYDIFKKFERFHKVGHLRTFIALPINPLSDFNFLSNKVIEELIPKLGHLRVLSLSGYRITEIPNSFAGLKHLRYLNLSHTDIKCLPDSIGDLYNLQTLILAECKYLSKLPNSIGNLINLRHLDVSASPSRLEVMPSQIGKLKDLQILSNFIVGRDNDLKIKELKDMSNLRGKLCISKLENVVNIQDARDAGLKSKHKLESLMMKWSHALDDLGNGGNEMDVLDSLQPHQNLNKLEIESYGGPEFPRWLTAISISKMVDLSIVGCRNCTSLPCLGWLPLLKRLRISGMDGVKAVGAEFYGQSYLPNNCFRSLESLVFEYMSIWKHWEHWSSSTESLFPCLRQLIIQYCPKLNKKLPTYLPSLTNLYISNCPKLELPLLRLPSLGKLEVNSCNEVVLRSGIDLTSLMELTVFRIFGLIKLREEFVQFLGGLRVLNILACKELKYLWEHGYGLETLHHLQQLTVTDCHQLVSLGEGEEQGLPCNLQSLKICNCNKLERIPNGWQSLTCLGKLYIFDCPRLVSFPEVGFPPMLRHLTIQNCEGLKCLPEGMMVKVRNNSNSSSSLCLLEFLLIRICPSLVCFPNGQLPTTLKQLIISHCKNLKSFPQEMMQCNSIANNSTMDMCALEYLMVEMCPSLIGFPRGALPTTLKELYIHDCEKLESLPEGLMHHHSNSATTIGGLQVLGIHGCSSLTSFPRGKFPSTLRQLEIWDCAQLESISEDMFHSTNNSLQSLCIRWYPNLKTLPNCLYNLRQLQIGKCEHLELLLHQMQNLTCLTTLEISNCENVKTPLYQWGLTTLTSLKYLHIGGIFPDATSFSDDHHLFLLPTTLISLSISNFQNLESLASLSLQNLASLEQLWICGCPKLLSILPREERFPDTLSKLDIQSCPLLKQRFSKEEGEDWPKVAHIPCVEIDFKSIFLH